MRRPQGLRLLAGLITALGGCRPAAQVAAADFQHAERAREQQLTRRMAIADADPKRVVPIAKWINAAGASGDLGTRSHARRTGAHARRRSGQGLRDRPASRGSSKTIRPRHRPVSRVTIPFAQVVGTNKWKSLHPSDMTIDPTTGDYVIITSREKALIEITRSGELVRSQPLPSGHNQPEGIAITKDSILMLSDESNRAPPAITLFRWRPSHSSSTGP